jgi:type I restriction enzyme S subunit
MPETRTVARTLHLPEHELEQVQAILRQYIPGRQVWAFGSRATGGRMLKRFSDLDLAVDGKLNAHESAGLADAFEESPLPIKVDVVELALVDAEFRDRIEKDFVVVQGGT